MRNTFLLLFLSFTSQFCFSQESYKVNYDQLKEYEGLYEYYNHTTLKMAASPKDTILYAILDKSRYSLTPIGKDLFLNMQKVKVQFFRDKLNNIAGYINDKDTFNLLNKNVDFPKEMWFPRPLAKSFKYKYNKPKAFKDGLKVGSIKQSGLNKELLAEMTRKIVDGTYPNVHSVLIIKDGKLVFEEYFYEYTKDTLQELRSATKSFFSALTGIAIEKGFIKSKNEKVLSYFPEYTFDNISDAKRQITIENLLTQQSGLDCDITNPKSEGNETTMSNTDDWVKFTLDLPMSDTPGGKGMYCSGNPIILGRIIEKQVNQTLPEFAVKTLFTPLGITQFKWNFKPDKSSSETFCQLYLKPRDMGQIWIVVFKQRQLEWQASNFC
jgi:hypothetical protein